MGGEDPLREDHPVDVVRGRLPADEDHALAGPAPVLGRVGVEDDLADGRPGRGVQPLGGDVERRLRVEHRVQKLVELGRVDARDRLLAGDQPLVHHVHRRAQRGRRGPLRRARLEEVEPSLLDRELRVLHVAVVLLEPPDRLDVAG